jgi:ABC-2 type transport system ATP-binding protein
LAVLPLVAEDVVKEYSGRRVLGGVSLRVEPGEILTILGPNGAGKTTLVEIAEGLRRPTTGRVSVFGHDAYRAPASVRDRIGAVLQEQGVEGFYRVGELIALRSLYYSRPLPEVAARFGLEDVARTQVRKLSGGLKRRLAVALAFVGSPDLVFLDEPTVGMDPEARQAFYDTIRSFKASGCAMVLTTHYLEEAERLSDEVVVLKDGQVIAAGSVESIRKELGVSFVVKVATVSPAELGRLGLAPAREGSATAEVVTDDVVGELHRLTSLALQRGVEVVNLEVSRLSLEEMYMRLTKEGKEKERLPGEPLQGGKRGSRMLGEHMGGK